MKLLMTAEEAALRDAIGTQALLHARAHVADEEVADVRWQAEAGMAYGTAPRPGGRRRRGTGQHRRGR